MDTRRLPIVKYLFYRIKSSLFRHGKVWDKQYGVDLKNINEFVKKYLNEELNCKYDVNSPEYVISSSSSSTINDKFRSNRQEEIDYKYSEAIRKYKAKTDIVLYRGASEIPYDYMINNSKDFCGIDYYEKGYLHTSLIKGKECDYKYKLRIFIPSGTNALYIGFLYDEEQYEIIVQRGVKLKIVSIDNEYINCKLLGTD